MTLLRHLSLAGREVHEAIIEGLAAALPPIPAHRDAEMAFDLAAEEIMANLFFAEGKREAIIDYAAECA